MLGVASLGLFYTYWELRRLGGVFKVFGMVFLAVVLAGFAYYIAVLALEFSSKKLGWPKPITQEKTVEVQVPATPETPADYPHDTVNATTRFGKTPGVLLRSNLAVSASQQRKDEYHMQQWLEWIASGIVVTDYKNILVIDQNEEFSRLTSTFTASIVVNDPVNVMIVSGVAFLVSKDSAGRTTNYRQIIFDIPKDSPDNANTLHLTEPRQHESLRIIMVVQARNNEVKLPKNAANFGATIQRRR